MHYVEYFLLGTWLAKFSKESSSIFLDVFALCLGFKVGRRRGLSLEPNAKLLQIIENFLVFSMVINFFPGFYDLMKTILLFPAIL